MNFPAALPPSHAPGKRAGRLWIVAAALLWSTSGLFVKSPIFAEWPEAARGPLMAFWRAVFAAAVLAPLIRRPRWRRDLMPLMTAFTLMSVTYLSSMTLTTAANAIWLQSTAPWWVFGIGVLVLREPFDRRNLTPLVFAALGVGLILGCEIRGQARVGVALGLGSGAAYATVVIFMRRLRGEDPVWLVAVNHAVVAVALLPWVVGNGICPTLPQLIVLAAFGVVQMAVPYLCLLRGLRNVGSQEAVVIGLLEPILLPLWVFLCGHETPDWWTTGGATLILLGLLLRYVLFGGALRGAVTPTGEREDGLPRP